MVNLAMIPDALAMLGSVRDAFRIRIGLWTATVVSILVAWRFSWFWLIATIVLAAGERLTARQEKRFYAGYDALVYGYRSA